MKAINKLIVVLAFISFALSACSQNSLLDRRKATMLLITDCIRQNDTLQLWKLIDTSFDKERLNFDIAFLHRQFVKHNPSICKDDFKILPIDKEYYNIKIEIQKNNIDYVDLKFHFSPFVADRVVTVNKYVTTIYDEPLKPHGNSSPSN